MKKYWFWGAAFLFAIVSLAPTARADEPVTRIKIISAAQTIATSTPSAVFTIEAQDATGSKVNVATTTRVTLATDSPGGQFLTSSATGPCGTATTTSVTISNGTSRKSFCYVSSTPGNFTISISVLDQPAVAGDSQLITIGDNPVSPVPSPPPSPQATTTASSTLTTSLKVKIYRFLPNPAGSDGDSEWVEIKSEESEEVLLDGWLLDDKDTGGGPAADALTLSGVILPGEVKRFMLSAGVFALNNTGGDEINLYFADLSLADKVEYSVVAYDDGVFEFRESIWQPPVQPQASSGGGGGAAAVPPPSPVYAPVTEFKLNEILPNPFGDDKGREWVEIYNSGNATATLAGYFLANGEAETWGSKAWVIPTSTAVGPLGIVAMVLPKEAFSLGNSGTDKVKLFSPQKQLIDSISYEDAPENQSWAKTGENQWEWGVPTFNLTNNSVPKLMPVFISEILPMPAGDGEEFIELFNPDAQVWDLEGSVLQVGTRKKVFEAGTIINPAGFLTFYEDSLSARLNNAGQSVRLYDAFGRLVSEVLYPKSQTGLAYASTDGKSYVWTSSVTPETANEYILGESVAAATKKETTSSAPKSTIPEITKAQAKEILQANEDLKLQLAVLQESINQLASRLNPAPNPSPEVNISAADEVQTPKKPLPIGRMLVWPAAFSALGGAVYVVFRKVKK
jgi:hypothetical protein